VKSGGGYYTVCTTITNGAYSLPVGPSDDIVISGSFTGSNGLTYNIESQKLTVETGSVTPPVIDLKPQAGNGIIRGSVALSGLEASGNTLNYHYLSSSPQNLNISGNGGKYSFTLYPGTYSFYYADSYLNNGDDYFRHPYSSYKRTVTLAAGEEAVNDISSNIALIKGKITLDGIAKSEDISEGVIYAYGIQGTDTEGGQSWDRIAAGTGDYDLIVSEGEWDVFDIRLRFNGTIDETGDTLNSTLDIKDYSRTDSMGGSISATAGETLVNDIEYETGAVIINFIVPEGATLRNPWLDGQCVVLDGNGNPQTVSKITAQGSSAEAAQGRVAFIGIPGIYHLAAFADVISGGVVLQNQHFGDVEVEVRPGKVEEHDPTGSIIIKEPKSGYTTCDDHVVINGTAAYDEEITGILVNGQSVNFVSSKNPEKENEVAFDASLALDMGENTAEITVVLAGDKTKTHTMTVYRYVAGVFTVGDDGAVVMDWLYDGGMYEGELGIFSLTGMNRFEPNSPEFIREAAKRVLSDSEKGYLVFSDPAEGARFSGFLGGEPEDWNEGAYQNVKRFKMKPGDTFATILVPNATFRGIYDNPPSESDVYRRPLFSLASSNPEHGMYLGQIADINGKGNAFIYEDRNFINSDRDYNDLIFQVQGVIVCEGKAPTLDSLIAQGIMDSEDDWREFSDLGKEIMDRVAESSSGRILITSEGAADLFVYDADGKECGKEGKYISGAEFDLDGNGNQVISLLAPKAGNYRIVLRAKDNGGTGNLTVTAYRGETEISSETKTVSMSSHQILKADIVFASDLTVSSFGEFKAPADKEGNLLVYDFNGDEKIDDSDIAKVSSRWNAETGDEGYDAFYDLDGDGYIGILDIMPVVSKKSVH